MYSAQNAAQAFTSQMEAQGLEAQLEGLSVDDKPMQHRPSLYGEDEGSSSTVSYIAPPSYSGRFSLFNEEFKLNNFLSTNYVYIVADYNWKIG